MLWTCQDQLILVYNTFFAYVCINHEKIKRNKANTLAKTHVLQKIIKHEPVGQTVDLLKGHGDLSGLSAKYDSEREIS